MNAKQLYLADGTPMSAWICGECGMTFNEKQAYSSERCCVCGECGKSTYKKGDARRHLCDECWGPHYSRIDADKLEKAELIEWDGPIIIGDDYYQSPDYALDMLGDEAPEFAHTCHIHYYSLDAESILQDMIENASVEDFDESALNGVKELVDAIEAFNKKNAAPNGTQYWTRDSKRKVRLRFEKQNEVCDE